METKTKKNSNRKLSLILGSVVLLMFGFGFAMVPLYSLICSVAGINSIATNSGRVVDEKVLTNGVDKQRTVVVEFDVTLNKDIPFTVSPTIKRVEVHPGEAVTTSYLVTNTSSDVIITQAVPGITPWQATAYFHKTECFCFTQQTLNGNETKEMGLRFMVDRDLPEDIEVLTLSYTFMDTDRSLMTVTQVDNL
ncbi:MAG: cytochrome c oxidase assembly protein [Gammaproteobacteria bacterium]|nr:MAG: cytochrome c oxidase assembly protein [Gammaproteobacteria bacterium]